jgi:hypothetical protein
VYTTSFNTTVQTQTTWYDPSTVAGQPGSTVHHPRS